MGHDWHYNNHWHASFRVNFGGAFRTTPPGVRELQNTYGKKSFDEIHDNIAAPTSRQDAAQRYYPQLFHATEQLYRDLGINAGGDTSRKLIDAFTSDRGIPSIKSQATQASAATAVAAISQLTFEHRADYDKGRTFGVTRPEGQQYLGELNRYAAGGGGLLSRNRQPSRPVTTLTQTKESYDQVRDWTNSRVGLGGLFVGTGEGQVFPFESKYASAALGQLHSVVPEIISTYRGNEAEMKGAFERVSMVLQESKDRGNASERESFVNNEILALRIEMDPSLAPKDKDKVPVSEYIGQKAREGLKAIDTQLTKSLDELKGASTAVGAAMKEVIEGYREGFTGSTRHELNNKGTTHEGGKGAARALFDINNPQRGIAVYTQETEEGLGSYLKIKVGKNSSSIEIDDATRDKILGHMLAYEEDRMEVLNLEHSSVSAWKGKAGLEDLKIIEAMVDYSLDPDGKPPVELIAQRDAQMVAAGLDPKPSLQLLIAANDALTSSYQTMLDNIKAEVTARGTNIAADTKRNLESGYQFVTMIDAPVAVPAPNPGKTTPPPDPSSVTPPAPSGTTPSPSGGGASVTPVPEEVKRVATTSLGYRNFLAQLEAETSNVPLAGSTSGQKMNYKQLVESSPLPESMVNAVKANLIDDGQVDATERTPLISSVKEYYSFLYELEGQVSKTSLEGSSGVATYRDMMEVGKLPGKLQDVVDAAIADGNFTAEESAAIVTTVKAHNNLDHAVSALNKTEVKYDEKVIPSYGQWGGYGQKPKVEYTNRREVPTPDMAEFKSRFDSVLTELGVNSEFIGISSLLPKEKKIEVTRLVQASIADFGTLDDVTKANLAVIYEDYVAQAALESTDLKSDARAQVLTAYFGGERLKDTTTGEWSFGNNTDVFAAGKPLKGHALNSLGAEKGYREAYRAALAIQNLPAGGIAAVKDLEDVLAVNFSGIPEQSVPKIIQQLEMKVSGGELLYIPQIKDALENAGIKVSAVGEETELETMVAAVTNTVTPTPTEVAAPVAVPTTTPIATSEPVEKLVDWDALKVAGVLANGGIGDKDISEYGVSEQEAIIKAAEAVGRDSSDLQNVGNLSLEAGLEFNAAIVAATHAESEHQSKDIITKALDRVASGEVDPSMMVTSAETVDLEQVKEQLQDALAAKTEALGASDPSSLYAANDPTSGQSPS